MLSTTRRLQALTVRHYPRRPPAPRKELLDSASELLKRQPAGTSEWHAHLREVRSLIRDLHPATWEQQTWQEWTAQLQLWRLWMEGVGALHDLGALRPLRLEMDDPADEGGSGATAQDVLGLGEGYHQAGIAPMLDSQRIKADDFTPLFLALVQQPKCFQAKLDAHGEPYALTALSVPAVLHLMFDLGLMPTPFQLTLLIQHVPIDEILARGLSATAASSSSARHADRTSSSPRTKSDALDRAAASVRPLLSPQPYDTLGLRGRRGVRHHEIEYAKMLLNAAHLCMRKLDHLGSAGPSSPFAAALDKLRPYWQKHLRMLVRKVDASGTGRTPVSDTVRALLRPTPTEAFAAKLQIEDTLRTGSGPKFKGRCGVLDLSDPIETLKLLAAAVAMTAPPAPPSPSPNPLFAARAPVAAPSGDNAEVKPNPLLQRHRAVLLTLAPKPAPSATPAQPRFQPEAVSSLIRIAHAAARSKDFKQTLRLCDAAASFGISGRTAAFLAGAAQAPEDLERILPKLEALKVTPLEGGQKKPRGSVKTRLLAMARELDSAERVKELGDGGEEPRIEGEPGSERGAAATAAEQSPEQIAPRIPTYTDRVQRLMAQWGLT